ncbi:hypothetical protein [Leptolyngbya sp. 7M]|uniref:hypothetical protein n=1 Tax=Leptolyngbya sp. 7M TaxID=2812896 RepID=UPI001B8B5C3D|nr:hypothetical protein [Leptolyngbya sp. 7M]QYO64001.1 hypothetical protein JVX88_30090 [Leptolyngbya sp. 7M]
MLSVLIWLPMIGAAVIGFLPQSVPTKQVRNAALTVSGVVLLWTIWLFTQFDLSDSGLQFREYLPWIETAKFGLLRSSQTCLSKSFPCRRAHFPPTRPINLRKRS